MMNNRDYLLEVGALIREFAPELRHVYFDVQFSTGDHGNWGVLKFMPVNREWFEVFTHGPRDIDRMLRDVRKELSRRAILFKKFDFLNTRHPRYSAFSNWFARELDEKIAERLINES